MSEAGPKLYTNKPKKAQLKQFKGGEKKAMNLSPPEVTAASSSSAPASAAAASYKVGGGSQATTTAPRPPPPPPPSSLPPKEPFAKRYKFMWPLLLAVNFSVGAYLFMRTKKKDTDTVEETATAIPTPVVTAPVVVPREPIPENQQRELFKWMLDEKRKIKPKDSEEKKRLEEEKAVLKHFLRVKSIPSI